MQMCAVFAKACPSDVSEASFWIIIIALLYRYI